MLIALYYIIVFFSFVNRPLSSQCIRICAVLCELGQHVMCLGCK